MFTPLEIALGAMVIWISLLWVIAEFRWAKRESELLDRVMSKHYQEYVLAEDLRKPRKPIEMPQEDIDVLPVT